MYKYIIILICILYPTPIYAMTITELMKETVSYGKPGFAILLIIGAGIAAFIGEQILIILGKKNFAVLVGIVATFIATLIMLNTGFEIVNKLLALF